ncbi:MAG: tRNA (guanosine(37)-N1)-methyltransferase TrmD [Eggerthellaceae bacterium]|jgi:tRNA (guanine37-N1)-methyltransferase
MRIETLSTFPDMYNSVMGASMMKRAQEKGILDFSAYDLRDWTHDRHRTTDDEPYGGGVGLVMQCGPIFEAYDQIAAQGVHPCTIFLSPTGEPFSDTVACELAREERLLFICGHYEGIDERAYTLADRTLSIGDYVLTSGELASMVVIDAVVRKLPGVLGADTGAEDESFHDNLLEYPQYTRPAEFRGMAVPEVLTSGDHAKVALWRRRQSLKRTFERRPDLLEHAMLTDDDRAFLKTLSQQSASSASPGEDAIID